MTWAAIALGANLGEPRKTLQSAALSIGRLPRTQVIQLSSFYVTEPIDSSGPDYVNAVMTVSTQLSAEELLRGLFEIEDAALRVRPVGVHNAPRTLDLDLLLYGEEVRDTEFLRLPHPRMHQRAFVLVPLLEIAPECIIPGKGRASEFLDAVQDQRIERLD